MSRCVGRSDLVHVNNPSLISLNESDEQSRLADVSMEDTLALLDGDSRLSDDQKFQLVEEVKARTCIWLVNDSHYKDRNSKRMAWIEIANAIGADVPALIRAWNSLTRQYNYNARKVEKIDASEGEKSATNRNYTSDIIGWKFWKPLSFLRNKRGNITSSRLNLSRKRTSNAYDRLFTNLPSTTNKQIDQDDTQYDYFGKMIAKTLKRYNSIDATFCIYAQKQIQKVITAFDLAVASSSISHPLRIPNFEQSSSEELVHQPVLLKRSREYSKEARKYSVRPENRHRFQRGEFATVFSVNRRDGSMEEYCRLDVGKFDWLLKQVGEKIAKKNTCIEGIGAEQRLALTLRYLSQGLSIPEMADSWHMGRTTVYLIVKETSEVIRRVLEEQFPRFPDEQHLRDNRDQFWHRYQFPNCICVIDGRYLFTQTSSKSKSNRRHSVLLLAAVDVDFCFSSVQVILYANKDSDWDTIFDRWDFVRILETDKLEGPTPTRLPNIRDGPPFPNIVVGDRGFPLRPWLMTPFALSASQPYDQRIFDSRLERCRSISDTAFSMLVHRWRILESLNCCSEMAANIILCCVSLHNWLMKTGPYSPVSKSDELIRFSVRNQPSPPQMAHQHRNTLMNYFVNEGSVT